jgi:hypothetical protein
MVERNSLVGAPFIYKRLNLNSSWEILILPDHLYLMVLEGLDLKHSLSHLIGIKEAEEHKEQEEYI